MSRPRLLLAAALLAAAAACAAPPPPGPSARTPAVVVDPSYVGPRATPYTTMWLCRGAYAYTVGAVTPEGLVADYTSHIATAAGPLLRNPTEGACASSGFGLRPSATGGGRDHLGLDLVARRGSFIYAAGPGRVAIAGARGDFGLMLEIDHGSGVRTRYAHLSEINPNLREGAEVEGGAAIGRMGSTGLATGVHLHYEVLVDGVHVNPLTYGR